MSNQQPSLLWAAFVLWSSLSLALAIEYTQSNTPTDNQQYPWDSKVSLDFTTLNTLPDNFWTVSDYFAGEKLKRPTIPFDRGNNDCQSSEFKLKLLLWL
ncbi:hypothetical protein BKA69DRAFT_1104531 [Paraphysoderma sedebokerense]|nr:hypothetical protein BKA69DRAFT_1104531 [Paraphysoderma sedebokerense]